MKSRKKFTLIELLVVIAIIAILASMLLPALNKARETAKKIKCVSRMKTLGTIFMMYTDSYDGYLVVPRVPPNKVWWWQLSKNRQLNYKSDLLKCPSREPDKNFNSLTTTGYDFAINQHIANIPAGKSWARLNRVKNPSRTGHLFESKGNFQIVPGASCSLAFRHNNNGTNILFIDGHVASFKSGEFPYTAGGDRAYFPWSVPNWIDIGVKF